MQYRVEWNNWADTTKNNYSFHNCQLHSYIVVSANHASDSANNDMDDISNWENMDHERKKHHTDIQSPWHEQNGEKREANTRHNMKKDTARSHIYIYSIMPKESTAEKKKLRCRQENEC